MCLAEPRDDNLFTMSIRNSLELNHVIPRRNKKADEFRYEIRRLLVREAGVEPARPEWTLEPESSESANSTTRAHLNFECFVIIASESFLVKPKIHFVK